MLNRRVFHKLELQNPQFDAVFVPSHRASEKFLIVVDVWHEGILLLNGPF